MNWNQDNECCTLQRLILVYCVIQDVSVDFCFTFLLRRNPPNKVTLYCIEICWRTRFLCLYEPQRPIEIKRYLKVGLQKISSNSILAFTVHKHFWYLSTGDVEPFDPSLPKINAETGEVHTLLLSGRNLSPVLLWRRSKGSRVLVFLPFLLSRSMHTTGSFSHRAQVSRLLSRSLPPPNTTWSATWVTTTPGTLSHRCHLCHWISCGLQPYISAIFCSLPTR